MKNNEYPNWLVPFDIAFMLERIGFDEKCLFVYHKSDEIKFKMDLDKIFEDTSEYYFEDLEPYEEAPLLCILCPTWEQVFQWFREKGYESYIKLESHSHFDEGNYYYFEITEPNLYQLDCKGNFDSYEEAREALVKALIQTYKQEHLINKSSL